MKRGWLFAAVLAYPMFLSSASAADSSEPPAAAAQEEPKKEKMICRVDKATGSRVRVNRVCMTRSQWDEMKHNIRTGINQVGQNGRGPSTIGSLGPN